MTLKTIGNPAKRRRRRERLRKWRIETHDRKRKKRSQRGKPVLNGLKVFLPMKSKRRRRKRWFTVVIQKK